MKSRFLENSRFSMPGGDTLNFYIPNNFLYIIKNENNQTVRGQGANRNVNNKGNSRYDQSANPSIAGGILGQNNQSNKTSTAFKEFLKFIQRTGRVQGRKNLPNLKELMKCKEYREYDIKKTLQCEIREWIIPMGNSEEKGSRMLLFKIPKNQQEMKQNANGQNNDNQSFEDDIREQVFGEGPVNGTAMDIPQLAKQQTKSAIGLPFTEQRTMRGQKADPNQPPIHHSKSIVKKYTLRKQQIEGEVPPHESHEHSSHGIHKKKTQKAVNAQQVQRNLSFAQSNTFAAGNQSESRSNKLKQTISFDADQSGTQSKHMKSNHSGTPHGTTSMGIPDKHSGLQSMNKESHPLGQSQNSQLVASARDTLHNKESHSLKLEGLHDHKQMGQVSNRGVDPQQQDKIDLELLKFERQETDDMDEDDQEQLETERIDVKKDIALNDEMMNNNPSETGMGSPAKNGEPLSARNSKTSKHDGLDSNGGAGGTQVQENVQNLFVDQQNPLSTTNMDHQTHTSQIQYQSRAATITTKGALGAQTLKEGGSQSSKVRNSQFEQQTVQSQQHRETEILPQVETEREQGPSSQKRKPRQSNTHHHPHNNYDSSNAKTHPPVTNGQPEQDDAEDGEGFMDEDGEDEGSEYPDEGGEYGEEYDPEDIDDEEYGNQEDVLAGHDQRSVGSDGEEDVLLGKNIINIGPSPGGGQSNPRRSRGSRTSFLYKTPSEYQLAQQQDLQKTQSQGNIMHMSGRDLGNLAPSQSINPLPPPQPKKKIHDYARIVTNPRYKCFDEETCGSAYFNDCNASEKEIDIRETIKKRQIFVFQRAQTKRRRKANKIKAAEDAAALEAMKENAGTPTDIIQIADPDDPEGKKKKKKVHIKEDSKSHSFDDFSEKEAESKPKVQLPEAVETSPPITTEEQATMETTQATAKNSNEEIRDDEQQSSLASSIQSQNRTFYSLKQAIDERFVPLQIRNLRFVANIVWFSILLLSVCYFIIQSTLFSEIQSYIQIIVNSEKRIDDIMTINLKLTDISLINEDIYRVNGSTLQLIQNSNGNQTALTKSQVVEHYIQQFLYSSTQLQDSQTELSLQTSSLDEEARMRINPNGVELLYFDVGPTVTTILNKTSVTYSLPNSYSFNIWEAILQISVAAYALADQPELIMHNRTQMVFIAMNCMNSVLLALKESTDAIVEQSDAAREYNNNIFLILVLSVSGSLVLSMAFLLPVIRRAKENKQEVFILLTHKKVEKQIEEQLKKCRWFITKYQQQSENQNDYEDGMHENHIQNNAAQAIEENTHMPSEKDIKNSNDEKKDDYISKVKKQKRKWRPLNNNFMSITVRFVMILLLIEAFFLYTYLMSKNFLEEVSLLTKELRLLISRQPQLEFLLLMEKELLYSNATRSFLQRPVQEVAEESLKTQNDDYEALLQLFQSNFYSHTNSYNKKFNDIMNADVCSSMTFEGLSAEQCQTLNGGILKKGVYNAVVKYWTHLRHVLNDFFGSQRTTQDSLKLLNNEELSQQQQMMETILKLSHQHLGTVLKEDIDMAFKNEYASNQTVFVIFVMYCLFVYLVVWRMFMRHLLEELWRAKACLSVLPMEICFRIEEIRAYIYQNSSGLAVGSVA